MKKSFPLSILIVLLSGSLQAQMHLFIAEQTVNIEDASLSAWVIPVPSSMEYALDQFQDFSKDRLDIRMKKEDDLLYMSEEVTVPRITALRGDLIAYAFSASGHNDLAIVYKLGYDISLNTMLWSAEMGNLRSLTKEFMLQLYSNYYTDSLAVLEKELDAVEKETSSMKKDVESNSNKINRSSKNLAKEKDQIKAADLEAEIGRLTAEIELINQQLPDLGDQAGKLRMKISALKNELVEVQNAVGAI